MAEEPQPSTPPPHDGAEPELPKKPATGEDRKTAAAMENLVTGAAEDDAAQKSTAADTEKLGQALSNLTVRAGKTDDAAKNDVAKKEEQAEVKKKIKVETADVTFLVEELEVSKSKATDMLKANGGDRMTALKAFVLQPTKA